MMGNNMMRNASAHQLHPSLSLSKYKQASQHLHIEVLPTSSTCLDDVQLLLMDVNTNDLAKTGIEKEIVPVPHHLVPGKETKRTIPAMFKQFPPFHLSA